MGSTCWIVNYQTIISNKVIPDVQLLSDFKQIIAMLLLNNIKNPCI